MFESDSNFGSRHFLISRENKTKCELLVNRLYYSQDNSFLIRMWCWVNWLIGRISGDSGQVLAGDGANAWL